MPKSLPMTLRLSENVTQILADLGDELGTLGRRATLEIVLREVQRLRNGRRFPSDSILFTPVKKTIRKRR